MGHIVLQETNRRIRLKRIADASLNCHSPLTGAIQPHNPESMSLPHIAVYLTHPSIHL
jgi:hypothetical protein